MERYQLGREYELIIGDPLSKTALLIEPPMEIRFRIEKHIYNNRKLNTATFEILNLSQQTRKTFENIKYPQVIFSCGYRGVGNLGLVFSGQAVSVSSEKTAQGIVTKLNCAESFVQLHNVLDSFTVPAGKTVRDVILEVASKMQNTAIGQLSGDNIETKLASGYPAEGTAKEILNELSKAHSLQWRVDKNTLYVRDDGGTYKSKEQEVYLITPESGLLNIPSYQNKKAGKTESDETGLDGIEFTALLNPAVTAGSFVEINSGITDIQGVYQVRDITYEGSFREREWYIKAECDEIKKD